jgi:hypothetical protein
LFPDLESLKTAFPNLDSAIINDDLAFPAMLTFLPSGLLGLLVAALIAAFMSTISTHLNWGSSYIVHDFYKRFIKPEASENQLVMLGRISTVVLMIGAALLALVLTNALQAFNILLQVGAGTGLIFILRWFWWRINAISEISAMLISFALALIFEFGFPDLAAHLKLIYGVAITTVVWIVVTLITPPSDYQTLIRFYKLIKPYPYGWKPIIEEGLANGDLKATDVYPGKLSMELACMFAGVFMVYGALFGTGFWIYGDFKNAIIATGVALLSGYYIIRTWPKISSVG